MANVRLVFTGTELSGTQEVELECFCNINNQIHLRITDEIQPVKMICLDKATAIKFHKELKKQISFIQPENDNNNE